MDEFIESLKTEDLRKLLRSRNLSISYKLKVDLVKRLKASLTEEDNEATLRDILKGDDEEDDQFEDTVDMVSSFVFKDVEDALEKFTGESTKPFSDWVKNYEDVATTCGWNDIQKYLFARKLLRGAARKAVEADKTVIDYKLLVEKLKNEFEEDLPSYEIHRTLMQKKKVASESYLEYFYDMQKIGPKLDEVSMVRYIVDGLPEEKSKKAILYDATKLAELKTKLKVYDRTHKVKSALSNDRCKNCGSKSHQQDACPDQTKGKRCFKCNNFGHMARECTESEYSKSSGTKPKSINYIMKPSEASTAPILKLQSVGMGQYKLLDGNN